MVHVEVFLNSCYDGNLSAVQSFLTEGISPDVQNAEGETALQIAAANGFCDIVNLLLRKGASVDLPNNYGWTPLMHAARYGHFEIVSCLIQKKAKVNICNKLGLRPIDIAAWSGSLSCVKLIVGAGAIIDNLPFSQNQDDTCDISPLMSASLRGHYSIFRLLLEEGSSANQASAITGLTPLMLAACNGHKSIVETLSEFGGDANKTDKCNQTALDLAVTCCREDVIAFLEDFTQPNLKKSSGGTSNDVDILRVVRNGDFLHVKSILQQNPSLCNYTSPVDGVTPLMIACTLGLNDIIDILIKNGAHLNAQDLTNGWTPLMYAVFHRQAEIVHLLLDAGVNVDICTANGYTAIDLAIHSDSSETNILGILLEYTESQEDLDNTEYLVTSPTSTLRKNLLAVEKISARSDSQGKFKDLIGGISNHFRQFSKSSTLSPAFDTEILDETLYDVFDEEDSKQKSGGNFLCISKFYAPNERFAHLLKEQEVEAINLPPLPCYSGHMDMVKTICSRKDKDTKKKFAKPTFRSLRTPNLLRNHLKKNSGVSNQMTKQDIFSDSLNIQHFKDMSSDSPVNINSPSETSVFDLKTKNVNIIDPAINDSVDKESTELGKNSHKDFAKEWSIEDNSASRSAAEGTAGGLTALLSQGSLKKYSEKFRDQEIDLETFQYLTEDDLNEIGINSFESRNQLLEIINKLKK